MCFFFLFLLGLLLSSQRDKLHPEHVRRCVRPVDTNARQFQLGARLMWHAFSSMALACVWLTIAKPCHCVGLFQTEASGSAGAASASIAWDVDRSLRFAMFGFSLGPLIGRR